MHCKRNKALANLLFVRPDAKRTTMLIRSFSRFGIAPSPHAVVSATSGSAQTGGLSWRTFESRNLEQRPGEVGAMERGGRKCSPHWLHAMSVMLT